MEPAANSAVRPVRELIERWCAAYGDLDAKKLAALESPDIEIVDRFGELHSAKQRSDEERFWAEGFEMIRREDFHPVCAIEKIRSTGSDVMIVHAKISYPEEIPLNGGDYISAFSEIHTFIVSRDEKDWRIAGHDITTRE
jgi:ketosteroid isomerase-like protein